MRQIVLLLMTMLVIMGCDGQNGENINERVSSAREKTPALAESEAMMTEDETEKETSDDESLSTVPSEEVEILKDEREGILPARIEIPTIDVDAQTRHLGLKDNGEMAVPESLYETAWFEPGYKVGAPGNSVIAGHVDDTVNPGVFSKLHTLEAGDEIIVHGADGTSLTFEVYEKELFDVDTAPVDKIFGYSHNSLLNLITCEGPYDYELGGTPNRWVIYTKLNPDA